MGMEGARIFYFSLSLGRGEFDAVTYCWERSAQFLILGCRALIGPVYGISSFLVSSFYKLISRLLFNSLIYHIRILL